MGLHIGVVMLYENGKKREHGCPSHNLPRHRQPKACVAHGVFLNLAAERERKCRSHGEKKEREHEVDPSQSCHFRHEGMCGRRCLRMVHPPRQDAAGHCGRQHHGEDGVAAQRVEAVGTRVLFCFGRHKFGVLDAGTQASGLRNISQAGGSCSCTIYWLRPFSTSSQRPLSMMCTMSNTIRPSESLRF